MIVYILSTILTTASYVIIITLFGIGWQKIKYFGKGQSDPSFIQISLVIAVRNEEHNLKNLLNSLTNQSLSPQYFEIIIVDDHSTDNSLEIINKHKPTLVNLNLLSMAHLMGKKNAISLGISNAKGRLIVTTDADCLPESKWLETIAKFYNKTQAKLIIGPVIMRGKGFFKKIQALDFYSLMASGGGAAGIGRPIMCNGANLAFEKNIYNKIIDPHNSGKVSGDDVFLLLNIKKNANNKILFLKSADAIVFTQAENSFIKFVQQRSRWASKSTGYKDFDIIFTAIVVLLINTLLLVNFLMLPFFQTFRQLFLIQFGIKSIVDFIFLYLTGKTFKQNKLLKYFLPTQLFNIFMVPYAAFSGFWGNAKWKDRPVKSN